MDTYILTSCKINEVKVTLLYKRRAYLSHYLYSKDSVRSRALSIHLCRGVVSVALSILEDVKAFFMRGDFDLYKAFNSELILGSVFKDSKGSVKW
jgi:hypothetical protein